MNGPKPLDEATPWGQIDLRTHSLTGWPKRAECPHCEGELCLLVATRDGASYECRGSLPHPAGSAYSDDRCHGEWSVQRYTRHEPCAFGPDGEHHGGELVACAACGRPTCDYCGTNEGNSPFGDWLCPDCDPVTV